MLSYTGVEFVLARILNFPAPYIVIFIPSILAINLLDKSIGLVWIIEYSIKTSRGLCDGYINTASVILNDNVGLYVNSLTNSSGNSITGLFIFVL